MEAREYATLAQMEGTYWWYRGQRDMVLDCLAARPPSPGGRVLDAGCGTGALLRTVSTRLGLQGFGIDLSSLAARYWQDSGDITLGHRSCLASVDCIPFADASFNLVYSIDVLCCGEVDPQRACEEFARVLRPGGTLLLAVPAYRWLLSEHDAAVHAVRRFTKAEVRDLLIRGGLRLGRMTHLFPTLFPAIAAMRLLRRRAGYERSGGARSDLRPLPGLVNRMLYGITQLERCLLPLTTFPWGTTILAMGEKPYPRQHG